jgi:hypothetical protein
MTSHEMQPLRIPHGLSRYRASLLAIAVLTGVAAATPAALRPAPPPRAEHGGGFCTATATQQYAACLFDVGDDLLNARAICLNESDAEDREECYADAAEERSEATTLCGEQRQARKALCDVIGEARYDPDFDEEDFDDDFRNLTRPNPYRPLGIGNRWSYVGGDETVEIKVLDKTKLIDDVTCIVVNDRVKEDGVLIEDTDDWFAQKKNGDVYYCGEEVKDYETFEGDEPQEPELVSIDGAFKWDRDGDKGGILFPGTPRVGATWRQEFSLGNAEDAATVLSTTYRYGRQPRLDRHVPRALAQRLCSAGNCVVTAEASPIEPDALERKYYARGIGLFLEVDVRSGDVVQLTGCNFDARCDDLPMP